MAEKLFDRAEEYDRMLQAGLALTGEDKDYYARGRVEWLQSALPVDEPVQRVLDFGCGIGDTAALLAAAFPGARVIGVDTAADAVRYARERHHDGRIEFGPLDAMDAVDPFCLCYCSGVFHHIEIDQRAAALQRIHRALRPGGHFALFENNPWNPGTRLIMSRIEFDRDARTISPRAGRRLLTDAGFSIRLRRSGFYFPRWLRWLRPLERPLGRVPLGGQYLLLARKNDAAKP